ncbi:tetratricopeptide repeat protein [Chondromyces crocatus]|uniref:Uncharacterized protein n=1 Tax=Chondromyces crocatus TaxID=52 RepID=A0A0K1EB61_CHOCO|nr:tetratricopeptide repeat protein [Chondromyces crocatus]AKT38095.1 uncharacterized protein CMC5_022370 [Chondromyces crocatus]
MSHERSWTRVAFLATTLLAAPAVAQVPPPAAPKATPAAPKTQPATPQPPAARPAASPPSSAQPSPAQPATASKAQPQPTPSENTSADDDLTRMAREMFERGVAAWDAEKYEECRTLLTAAWLMKQHPQVALNLGSCEVKLKRYEDAVRHLAYALRETPTSGPTVTPATLDRRKTAQTLYDEAIKHVARVRLTLDPPTAEVLEDGRSLGRGPWLDALVLRPGPHILEIRAENYGTEYENVAGKAGGEEPLSVKLKPRPSMSTSTSTSVIHDEQLPPPVAKHPLPYVLVGGFAVGALGMVTGAVLHGFSGREARAADALLSHLQGTVADGTGERCSPTPQPGACTALRGMRDNQDALANTGTAFLIGGGVVLAGTAAYMVTSYVLASRSNRKSVEIAPSVSWQGGGLSLRGTF